ncbi:hypothetical protein D3C76_403800 [compost metagenome]
MRSFPYTYTWYEVVPGQFIVINKNSRVREINMLRNAYKAEKTEEVLDKLVWEE